MSDSIANPSNAASEQPAGLFEETGAPVTDSQAATSVSNVDDSDGDSEGSAVEAVSSADNDNAAPFSEETITVIVTETIVTTATVVADDAGATLVETTLAETTVTETAEMSGIDSDDDIDIDAMLAAMGLESRGQREDVSKVKKDDSTKGKKRATGPRQEDEEDKKNKGKKDKDKDDKNDKSKKPSRPTNSAPA